MKDNAASKGKIVLAIALIAIFAFGGITIYNYWKFKTQKKEEAKKVEIVPVETALVEIKKLDWLLEQTGDIRPLLEVKIHPKVSGEVLEKILVEKGDFVQKGDLIATMEDDTIKARIRESDAALRSAKAKLNEVQANLNVIRKDRVRLEKLVKQHAVSQQKMDEIDARYEATAAGKKLAIAQIERAEASLNLLRILHKDHQIFSPIGGYVSARYIDPGSMSDTRNPIVQVSREDIVKIITTVTEKDYPHIKKGMEVELRVDSFPDRVFKGTVSIISPTLDPATRTGEIEIQVQNRNLILCSGMFVNILLYLGQKNALTIYKDALMRLPGTGSYYVYIVNNSKAMVKNIKIGLIRGNYAEIKEGLKEGQQVVIKGQNRLKDGMRVKVEGGKNR